MKIYVDGTLYTKDDARISVFDHGFLYGDGVFEGIRVYDGNVFRLKEHIDRLYTLARRSGVLGGKLVGAGGGGFLLVYAPRPEDTREAMAAARASELAFDFEFGGAYASENR